MQQSMQVIPPSQFLIAWHHAMIIGAIIAFTIGILLFLIYNLRVSLIKDIKERYDFLNANEIRWYKWVFLLFGIGIALLINLYGKGKVTDMGAWFFVRLFIGIAGATLVAYIAALVLDYYYPTKLSTKLKRLRFAPRISSKGNKMRMLSEEEEDVHLDPGMQAEENIFSIDYDVWIDEKTGEIKIEKYKGHLTALRCNNCGFFTMRVKKEEIVERYEDGSPKELVKHYQCSYCKNVRATQFTISFKESADYKLQKPQPKRNTRGIDAVKVEIHSSLKGKMNFEFQSIEQTQKFLEEFDYDKMS